MSISQKKITITLACTASLIALLSWAPAQRAVGQDSTGEFFPPHVIESVSVTESPGGQTLRVNGIFNVERFEQIVVKPIDGESAYSVEIPGAIADPGLDAAADFSGAGPLQRVDVSAVADPDRPASGLVILVVQVAAGATLHFDSGGSHAGLLIFNVTSDPASQAITGSDGGMVDEVPADLPPAQWQGRPTLVRIVVLNGSGVSGKAGEVGILLAELRRHMLERQLGQRVEVVNISNATTFDRLETVIYYRPGFLRAALAVAQALPGDQAVAPTPPDRLGRRGIDLEILLGKDMP